MQVKIRGEWYDSSKEPILVALNSLEKEHLDALQASFASYGDIIVSPSAQVEAELAEDRKYAEDLIEGISRFAHELNCSYCAVIGEAVVPPSWNELEDQLKDSIRNGVVFHMHNADATPEESHNNWLRYKLAQGWKYGPEKNMERKEHPCLVPYLALPLEQQVKDYLFKTVVQLFLTKHSIDLDAVTIQDDEDTDEHTTDHGT